MNTQLQLILRKLDERDSLPPLSPRGVWDRALEAQIEALELPGRKQDDRVIALMAGLHLRNDSLDTSHSYAQEIEHDATGAYWHGIMHRMEGDYSNSKYWFMRAGKHPAMAATKRRVAEWLRNECDWEAIPQSRIRDTLLAFRDEAAWNPSQFADLAVWQGSGGGSGGAAAAARLVLEQLQQIEISELFRYTLQAVGASREV